MAGAEDAAKLMRMARKDFDALTVLSAELGVFAVQARYEEGLGSDEPLDRLAVAANARALLEHIERQVY